MRGVNTMAMNLFTKMRRKTLLRKTMRKKKRTISKTRFSVSKDLGNHLLLQDLN